MELCCSPGRAVGLFFLQSPVTPCPCPPLSSSIYVEPDVSIDVLIPASRGAFLLCVLTAQSGEPECVDHWSSPGVRAPAQALMGVPETASSLGLGWGGPPGIEIEILMRSKR